MMLSNRLPYRNKACSPITVERYPQKSAPYRRIALLTLTAVFFSLDAWGAGMDHYLWDQILHEYVENGLVNYQEMKNNPKRLNLYLEQVAKYPGDKLSKLPKAEKMAFYINAYNAITVKRIIDYYPPRKKGFLNFMNPDISIKNIPGVWDKIKNKVAGELLTLDDIEHKILRKEFKEPRIHMALVCASLGCPPLLNQAFSAEKLNKQLDKASRNFLGDKTRNRFCADCSKISLSKIFSWYGGDFEQIYRPSLHLKKRHGKKIASVITFAASFFPAKTKEFLLNGNYKTDFIDYSWILNDLK